MRTRHYIAGIITTTALAASGTTVAAETDPYTMKYTNDDFISLTGDVVSTGDGLFTLAFDDGMITVEMDDWDWYKEAKYLNTGEKVTVYGDIDHDLYETKKIEANSVYVHDRAEYYYANDADEEDYATYYVASYPMTIPDGTWMSTYGTVKSIDGRELTLDVGAYDVEVDTASLGYNPLDDTGYQQIDPGDRIYVSGLLDIGFFDNNELSASSIVTLEKDAAKQTDDS